MTKEVCTSELEQIAQWFENADYPNMGEQVENFNCNQATEYQMPNLRQANENPQRQVWRILWMHRISELPPNRANLEGRKDSGGAKRRG